MFTHHFQMSTQPFHERIPAENIMRDERITAALARLEYFLEYGSIALITGQTGAGKSSLLKLFMQKLNLNTYLPLYLYITDLRVTSILKLLVLQLGDTPKHTKGLVFNQLLDIAKNSKTKIFLVIDEAHLLSAEALTDLRLLVSSVLDDTAPMKILLTGQESLRQTLRRSNLADLANRISISYHLPPLTKTQTHAYIDHHLRSVAANQNIFEPQVKDLIFDFTGGLPRQINNIASACLIQAAIQKSHNIDQLIFSQAASECRL